MAIESKFIVNLRGKDFPLYAGVLDAATKAGLMSLVTTIVQIPCPENGNMAVVLARAEFEDGRVFEDVGDCSPATTSPQLAPAALRLASTRAKGRALRDGINVGQTMFEELPGQDDTPEAPRAEKSEANGKQEALVCSAVGCGKPLTKGQYEVSMRAYSVGLCPEHQKIHAARRN